MRLNKYAARAGVICQSALYQSSLLLACMATLFLYLATHPITPAVTIHTLPWKMRVEKCPFSLFSMASSLVLFVFGHGVETSHLGDVSAQELCQAIWTSHWNKLGLTYLPRARMKATSLRSTWPNMQEARERFKKTRSLCVMWGRLAMFRNRKWLFWDLPISVGKSANIARWVLVMHCLLIEETRRWNAD